MIKKNKKRNLWIWIFSVGIFIVLCIIFIMPQYESMELELNEEWCELNVKNVFSAKTEIKVLKIYYAGKSEGSKVCAFDVEIDLPRVGIQKEKALLIERGNIVQTISLQSSEGAEIIKSLGK